MKKEKEKFIALFYEFVFQFCPQLTSFFIFENVKKSRFCPNFFLFIHLSHFPSSDWIASFHGTLLTSIGEL